MPLQRCWVVLQAEGAFRSWEGRCDEALRPGRSRTTRDPRMSPNQWGGVFRNPFFPSREHSGELLNGSLGLLDQEDEACVSVPLTLKVSACFPEYWAGAFLLLQHEVPKALPAFLSSFTLLRCLHGIPHTRCLNRPNVVCLKSRGCILILTFLPLLRA